MPVVYWIQSSKEEVKLIEFKEWGIAYYWLNKKIESGHMTVLTQRLQEDVRLIKSKARERKYHWLNSERLKLCVQLIEKQVLTMI
jgi:hypothetical protein